MKHLLFGSGLAVFLALTMVACQGSPSPPVQSTPGAGTVYVTGSDAPLPSVLAFEVTLTGLTLSDGSSSVAVLSEPTAVEFGRLLGMRTLVALNSVPEAVYTTATLTLSNPVISFLDLSTTPASVGTLNGTLTQSSLTLQLNPPLTVNAGGLAGLHLHLRLRDSLQVDATGELTGIVDPHIRLRAIPPQAEDSLIDELRGGVSSVNLAGNSFTLQRRSGRLLTIHVDDQTQWEVGESLATLVPPALVEISGRVRADGGIQAASVEVLSRDHFVLGGLVLDPDPPTGSADRVTLLVREEVPDLSTIQVGRTATVEFSDQTRFGIHNFDLPLGLFLFNRAELVRGQRVAVGGAVDSSTTPATLQIRRVVLHRQGFEGVLVPGSVRVGSGNTGIFRLGMDGLFGYLFGQPLQVATSDRTRFVNLSGLGELETSGPVRLRVVGLLLRSGTGEPVLVAGWVERWLPEP